ncbi:SDR family NAD(P)-dependent oxidoreductase [Mycobacteroides abscessus]
MRGQLDGRRALVTGGSRGIGAAIVRRLASDGASVAFTYSSSPDEARSVKADVNGAGGAAVAIRADATNPDQVAGAVSKTVAELGGVDILVNNAGVFLSGDIESQSLEDFDRIVDINVKAIFVAIQHALPHMGSGGRIITIGSINGDRSPIPGLSLYSMSKAAVGGLTRGLARDLGPRGITINTIQPGPINTDMNPSDGELAEGAKPMIALGHYGQTTDIASLVSYLSSAEAGFVTGAAVNIDGGYGI